MVDCVGRASIGGGGSLTTSIQVISTDNNFAATTRDITITAVTLANVLMVVDCKKIGGNGVHRERCSFELTSTTNLRLTKGSASNGSGQYLVTIYELDSNQIKSNQFVSASASEAETLDIACSAVVTTNTFVFNHGFNTANTITTNIGPNSAELTTTTNVQIAVRTSPAATVNGRAQVLELN